MAKLVEEFLEQSRGAHGLVSMHCSCQDARSTPDYLDRCVAFWLMVIPWTHGGAVCLAGMGWRGRAGLRGDLSIFLTSASFWGGWWRGECPLDGHGGLRYFLEP